MDVSKAFTKFGFVCAVFFAQQAFSDDYDYNFDLTNSDNILLSRYLECGGRRVEERIVSYQGENFGIDLGADKDSILSIRFGGRAQNTEKGFSFLSCNTYRKARWDKRRQKKQDKLLQAREARNYTLPRSVVFLPEKAPQIFDSDEMSLDKIRDRQAARILAAAQEAQKQEEAERVPTEPILAHSTVPHIVNK